MRGNGDVGYAEEMPGDDCGHFKAVEVLLLYLRQDPLECVLDLRRPESPPEHHLDFCSHEKEVPSSDVDLAIESDSVQYRDPTPVLEARLSFEAQQLRHSRTFFHQNRADLNGGWHSSVDLQVQFRFPLRQL